MAALPRPPHRGPHINDRPPPSLPPRTARPPPPVAVPSVDSDSDPDDYLEPDNKGPEEIYDDCNENDNFPDAPDDVYDDCEDHPPPLPPQSEEVYDDFDEQPKLPARPPAKLPPLPPQPHPAAPQETYDDLDNVGPVVVQKIPKVRQIPPTPAPPPPVQGIVEDVYEDPDASQPPPPSNSCHDDVYEVDFDETGQSNAIPPPPPPPPPPKEQPRPPPARLPPQPKPAPAPAPAPGPGSFSINLGQLKDLRAGLRKVSVGGTAAPGPSSNSNAAGGSGGSGSSSSVGADNAEPKTYGECAPSVASAKKMFQDKAFGKPGGAAPKPAITPKFGTWKASASSSSSSNNSNDNIAAPKPPFRSPSPKEQTPSQSPDVTFLNKPNKAPIPSKPVTKYEPPPVQENYECDDIYDDASSTDTMDRFDWYHGYQDRKQAETKVKSVGKDGTYMVRVSEKDPRFPYTLVVLHNGHVNNLRIRKRPDNKFALGDEKVDELTFPDVMALINHHKNHHVVLLGSSSQTQVVLQHTPPKR